MIDVMNMDNSTSISPNSIVYENVTLGSGVIIEEFCVIGKPCRKRNEIAPSRTTIGDSTEIGPYSVLYEGVSIGSNCSIRDYSSIGTDSIIGDGVKVQYRAQIFKRVKIGSNCRIAGFCCNDSIIGSDCTMYGSLVHQYPAHGGCNQEKPPTVESNVIVAFGAIIAGDIVVGEGSYIAAGAVVTKNVPKESIVTGVNSILPIHSWNGSSLPREYAND